MTIMTQTLQDFADLNDYDLDHARKVVNRMRENTENPGLEAWADSLLDNE